MSDDIELTVRIPEDVSSPELERILAENPTFNRAKAWWLLLSKTLGGWPDITITKDPG